MQGIQQLSNIRQELLKLYSSDVTDADLVHIKHYLSRYFALKAINEADDIWDQKGYRKETMTCWLNEENDAHADKDSH